MSKAFTANDNRDEGKIFEALFFKQALRLGLLPIKNHLSCRFTYGGRVQVIKAELDFKLITRDGGVGYFDCKSYAEDHFVYSELDENQVKRAVLYNENKVPSGFVVWFRKSNVICFFSGAVIDGKGPRTRFSKEDGVLLGRFESFDLKALMTA